MRRLVVTFKEVPARRETETAVEYDDPSNGSEQENKRVDQVTPLLIALLAHGAAGVAVGNKPMDELRKEARVQSDIHRAGTS